MANKKFTEEEMNHLRASPHVLHVTPSIVHFSAKFKELFWSSILEGKPLRKIVIDLGIDPDILGENRLSGLKAMIRSEVRAGKGFRDLKTYGSYLNYYTNPEAKVKYLEQLLAYKDQEIGFLKKIISLGREEQES
ncbi:MAG: hypothetical protein DDT29_02323 [Dehalococcoidia bacterium]|nr:hypothetical protein [Bacillota bacterium]